VSDGDSRQLVLMVSTSFGQNEYQLDGCMGASGIFRITVRGWGGAVHTERDGVCRSRLGPSEEKKIIVLFRK